MAYSLMQLEALKKSYASGVTKVSYGDKLTEFRSLAEMKQVIVEIEAELGLRTRVRRMLVRTQGDKGL